MPPQIARRASAAAVTATLAAAAALAAAGTVQAALGPSAGTHTPAAAAAAWARRASAACRPWALRLQQVPAPAALNPLVLGTLARQALPLLEAERRALAAVAPPAALVARVRVLLQADAIAVAELRRVRDAAARGDTLVTAQAFSAFLSARDAARTRAAALGLRC